MEALSTPSLFLDKAELQELTQRTRRSSQALVLKALGIEHKVRPDGSIAVLRAHIVKVFDGLESTPQRKTKEATPNWEAM